MIEGLVVFAMGLLSIAEGIRLNVTERIQMYDVLGPGNYNIGVGLLLLIVSTAYLTSFRKERQEREKRDGGSATEKTLRTKMAAMFVTLAAYITLIYLAGYPLATLAFFLLINRVVGFRSWLLNGALSVGVSAAFYLVFVYGLDMIFSRGVLFDLLLG
jgi:hypothetical protein